MGIEENILTLCPECHRMYDEGHDRERMKGLFQKYLSKCYGREITEDMVKHDKWKFLKEAQEWNTY